MIDLSTLSPEILTARGAYSTVRGAHEDAKKDLQMRCGELMSLPAKILKCGQGDGAAEIDEAQNHLNAMRLLIDLMEGQLGEIKSLALQRAELKKEAWSK